LKQPVFSDSGFCFCLLLLKINFSLLIFGVAPKFVILEEFLAIVFDALNLAFAAQILNEIFLHS